MKMENFLFLWDVETDIEAGERGEEGGGILQLILSSSVPTFSRAVAVRGERRGGKNFLHNSTSPFHPLSYPSARSAVGAKREKERSFKFRGRGKRRSYAKVL